MKKRDGIVWLLLAVILIAIVLVFRSRINFDWRMFWSGLKNVSPWHIAAGIGLIYATFALRAFRWSVFVSPTKKVSALSLIGPNFIGFAAVALFGRLADLTRPYLISRKIALPLSTQVAVYTIERMFDLGAAAIIFSSALAFTPRDMPHHEIFVRTGLFSLAATLCIAAFAGTVRVAGGAVARFAKSALRWLSKPVAESVALKIEGFRDGLNALASWREFVIVTLVSLAMWGMIGGAYMQTAHAFVNTPELATLTYSRTMLLMASSIGASLLQLPIVGWFTQIAATAATMHALYGAPLEAATACGAMLLAVTFICVIPPGLIFARLERVGLRSAAKESEAAATEDLEGASSKELLKP
jgi:glycosyltransferase 2 family protein